MKRNLFLFFLFFLLFFLFAKPAEALEASRSGLTLWLNTMLPTLLPFLILSGLLLGTGAVEQILGPLSSFWDRFLGLTPYGAYAWILGMLCGYPMGAKLTAELYGAGKISRNEADYLLTFCSNASPMFLSSYLVLTVLERPDYILLTFALLFLCTMLCSLFFRILLHRMPRGILRAASAGTQKETPAPAPEEDWIDVSIQNGFETMARLGGYILLFSIFSAAVQTVWTAESLPRLLLLCLTEISTGLAGLQEAQIAFPLKYALAVSAASFGGLCILAQTYSVTHRYGLSLLPYLAGKILNFGLTFCCSLFVAQIVQ